MSCNVSCRITFEPYYVVLLDGYPRPNYGAVQFRFVIVLPPNAVSMDQSTKPLLAKQILSNFLNISVRELERKLGWKVNSYERFPKFDSVTEFMNVALIPVGIILLIFMLALAYWSSIISRSSGGGEDWFVSGSKSAVVKRTLEMIEQQKSSFADKDGLKEPCSDKLPRSSIQVVAKAALKGKYDNAGASKKNFTKESREGPSDKATSLHSPSTRSHSTSTLGSLTTFKNASGRQASHRRLSSIDDGNFNIKRHRKKRYTSRTRRLTQRQWKLTSMALGGFGRSQRP